MSTKDIPETNSDDSEAKDDESFGEASNGLSQPSSPVDASKSPKGAEGARFDLLQRGGRRGKGPGASTIREWRYIDDGGAGAFYLHKSGMKARKEPAHFVHEVLNDPARSRKFYHRHRCIRCRTICSPMLMAKNDGCDLFSFNMCEQCLRTTTPNLPEDARVFRNGDMVFKANEGQPMNFYMDALGRWNSTFRSDDIIERAKVARQGAREYAKKRRDANRKISLGFLCEQTYGLYPKESIYISWGFENKYDEYYGHHDKEGRPHGPGHKIFSDGTTYLGTWKAGMMDSQEVAQWQRPDGSRYDGHFVGNFKHGEGKQVYPNGDVYQGEWANGYEHGHGKVIYTDESTFEGRFRFGRRDGPGVFRDSTGHVERGNFKSGPGWREDPIPVVFDADNFSADLYHNPPTLKELATGALARAMKNNRKSVPSTKITQRLYEHIKPMVSETFVGLCKERFNPDGLMKVAGKYAFSNVHKEAHFSGFKINTQMMDTIIYFCEGNKKLNLLSCQGSNLDHESIGLICRHLHMWPNLTALDLSFNKLNLESFETILDQVVSMKTMTKLRLSGCRLNFRCADAVGELLITAPHLLDVDFSFNNFEALGAEPIARGLALNKTITSLNLRQNGFGPMGGQAFTTAMLPTPYGHPSLKQLNLVDNRIGANVMCLLSGRLQGTISDVYTSVAADEIIMPTFYKEGRFGETPMHTTDHSHDHNNI
jgi:hypothetical protein